MISREYTGSFEATGWDFAIFKLAAHLVGTALLCALLSVSFALSNGALLARGELSSLIAPIAGTMLMITALFPLVTAWSSSIRGQITTSQEISIVALAAVLGATTSGFTSGSNFNLLATVLVTIGLTTSLSGFAMLAIGRFGLGRLTRFLPFPIFAGFLAITGWHLMTGGLEIAMGGHLGPDSLAVLGEPQVALKVGLLAAFVATVTVLGRWFPAGKTLPFSVLLVVIAFNLFVSAAGLPRTTLEATGWLIAVPTSGINWPPISFGELLNVDWAAVGAGMIFAPFVVAVTAAGAMMNVSAIELETSGDIDLDVELRSMGISNVIAGLLGGSPGFPAVSATMLAHHSGVSSRTFVIVTGSIALAALVFAPHVIGTVPLPLLGAVLVWVGLSLILNWLIRPGLTLRRSEYAIILAIFGVGIAFGLPAGILTGLIAAVLLFAVEYARVNVIRFVTSGRDLHSRSISEARRSRMATEGDAVAVVKLAGFMFFGTSETVVQRLLALSEARPKSGQWYAVLDFSHVAGLDSSTALTFQRLSRLAERDKFQVVFAGLGPMTQRLVDGGIDFASPPFHTKKNLDAALRWVEEQLLGSEPASAPDRVPADATLALLLGSEAPAKAMLSYLTRVDFSEGERLIQQGSRADDIYFIESGSGSVILERDQGQAVEVMDFKPGTILGEVAFYGIGARSASAVAREPGIAWKLTREAIAQTEKDQPRAAAAFHRALARLLADRLQSANRLIRDLEN